MNKLKWWFRIVGAFYLLLALLNMYGTFVNPEFYRGTLPYAADDLVVRAFIEGWSPFAFELVGLATFMLWASRNPRRYLGAVWLLVWLELLHGIVDDLFLISRGYQASFYLVFILVHLTIIITGILFARQAEAEAA